MKNIILAICLALSFSFTAVYSARQDNGGGNNSSEWHRISYWECDNDNGDYGPWNVHTYSKDPSNDPGGPEESNRLDIGTTVKDEAPSPQPQPQSISTAAAAYTTAEGIYYTDDISSGVYEFIPHKEPQPLIDIDMNDAGWLCEPPLPPAEEPIFEDGGEAPDPCIGEPPIIGDPIVGEPPLPAEPTIGEPPLPIPEPTVGEPPLPPTVGEPPLAPDPELDVPVPGPVEVE